MIKQTHDKVVFIDRDGVINKDPGGWTKYDYVTTKEDFYFLPDVLGALKALADNKFKVIIISNQAGIGKGYFSHQELKAVNEHMLKEIERAGGRIYAVYYCPHTKEDNCNCRKPKTGLLREALSNLKVDIADTYFIGDTLRDIETGKSFDLKTILVLSGKARIEEAEHWQAKPDEIKKNLREAVDFIISKPR